MAPSSGFRPHHNSSQSADAGSCKQPQHGLGLDYHGIRSPVAAPTSLFQKWGALLASPTEWLMHPSCGGCLSQIAEHGSVDADGTVERALHAQGSQNELFRSSAKHASSSKLILAVTSRPCCTNRSRAPRLVYQGRINDLVAKIQSMPTPSSIRDQILTVHCNQQCVAPREAASPNPGNLSSPNHARNLLGLHTSPRGYWPENSGSDSFRRTQSLKAQPSPKWIEHKRSICTNSDDNSPTDQMKNPRLLEGIQFSDGARLFSSAIDLDWCCPTSTDESVFWQSSSLKKNECQPKGSTDCGGYVDYTGKFHPCTFVSQRDRRSQASPSGERCQGCVFRRGMNANKNNNRSGEEDTLYYDSDPGERFSVDRAWMHHIELNERDTIQLNVRTDASYRNTLHQIKLSRRKSKSKSCRVSNPDVSHHSNEEKHIFSQQNDHHDCIYDYFSQIDHPEMQTGICTTKILDVGRCVQDALSSTWRLYWRSKNIAKLCDVWIERGYRRNRTEIVEPKLMWRELPQPSMNDRRQLDIFTDPPHQVNLFSVRRILQIKNVFDGEVIDMDCHPQKHVLPCTKPNSLLLIRSSLNEDFIFEASCLAERDHIVHLLKIATARLVSHAVAGNGDLLLKEFFNDEHVP